jgi:hypothetical protein
VCRAERSDFDFNLSIPLPEMPAEADVVERQEAVITASRKKYGTPRAQVEAMLRQAWEVAGASARPPLPAAIPKPPPEESPASPPIQPAVPTPLSAPPAAEPPKPSEVPKPTDSETKEPAARVVAEPQAVTPASPQQAETKKPNPAILEARDLGRGGAIHKAIQERIQTEANALGFLAEVESQLSGQSNQAADVVLRKDHATIAVEISVTTTVDHEFGNVKKCLAAGFGLVAVVSPNAERLKTLGEAVRAGMGSEAATKVRYHTPDGFIAELQKLARELEKPAEPPAPQERIVGKYKVKRHVATLSPEERRAKDEHIVRIISGSMKRKS